MTTSTVADDGLTLDELRELVPDFETHLKAGKKAATTVDLYLRHLRYLFAWLEDNAPDEPVGKPVLERYFVALLERNTRRNNREGEQVKATYANAQYRSAQQFWAWLEREEEITRNPFDKMSPPSAPLPKIPVRPDDDVRALLATCKGRTFVELRDTAIIRLFADTGVRVSGMAGINLDDVNFDYDTVEVVLKGGGTLTLPFGAKTSEALRRYMRARRKRPGAERHTALWLGDKGPLTTSGIRQMLERRAEQAEIKNFNPHLFRHLFAHTWLANGGNEGDLMRLMGWKSRAMLLRYGESAAAERARNSHRQKALGDRF
ncbi:tyrosine-type recombinase/integrase [Amycolatopsis thermoflava]|uniref:tyrosine-type recombinase/integrase n=1 Tax=Amycolatopsis thermoflava TaxID=84480 RepID=UPI00041001C0|nr:tyrosine-type recombinase/integrase [Amycolatopsis thermoflava]